jgi:hypothetical protein
MSRTCMNPWGDRRAAGRCLTIPRPWLQEAYWGHAGGIAGFRSLLNYAPEIDTVVVIVYNHDGADPEQSLADMMNPALPLLGTAE